jgi:hypothetical protein
MLQHQMTILVRRRIAAAHNNGKEKYLKRVFIDFVTDGQTIENLMSRCGRLDESFVDGAAEGGGASE